MLILSLSILDLCFDVDHAPTRSNCSWRPRTSVDQEPRTCADAAWHVWGVKYNFNMLANKKTVPFGARLCDWSAKFSSMTYRGQTLAFSLSGLKVSGFGQFVDYQYMLVMLLAIKPYRRIGRKRWGRFVTIWRDEQALGEGVGMKLSTPPWPHAYTHTKTERKYKRALLRLHRHRAWSHQELKWKCSRQ